MTSTINFIHIELCDAFTQTCPHLNVDDEARISDYISYKGISVITRPYKISVKNVSWRGSALKYSASELIQLQLISNTVWYFGYMIYKSW